MSKVFVTGGTGMLGGAIVRQLLARAYTVKCLLHQRLNPSLDGLEIEIVRGSLLDSELLADEMKDCDYVINAAASTQVLPRRDPNIWRVNFDGVVNLVKASKRNHIKRFVQIDTTNSFAEGSKEQPGTEMGSYTSYRFGFDYQDSKRKAHDYLLDQYQTEGLPIIIVSPSFMIGPYDNGSSSSSLILKYAKGQIPAYPTGGKSYVYSMDVAVAVVNALTMGRLGECYIASGENLTHREFFEKISLVMGTPFRLKKAPPFLTLLIGILSPVWARLKNKPADFSYSMAKSSIAGLYYSAEKCIEELKMPQTPIEIGIKGCLDWYHQNGFL